jgi:hypothetical protein
LVFKLEALALPSAYYSLKSLSSVKRVSMVV